MCRFLAYKGAPILMDELLYQPKNSLIHQSYHAQERAEPLNGDGFGLGWYVPEIDDTPALFSSIQPAWNNTNLHYLSSKIKSSTIFAHIRAATHGRVSETNCHPFHYSRYLFMHNGVVGGFRIIKRAIRRRLSDEIYDWIKGETDSEHFFALFLERLMNTSKSGGLNDMGKTLLNTMAEIREIQNEYGISKPTFLNIAITDGNSIVASRYVSDPDLKPHTLYYSEGSQFECSGMVCRMIQTDPAKHAVLIVSERLTEVAEDWHKIPHNYMIIVDKKLTVKMEKIIV